MIEKKVTKMIAPPEPEFEYEETTFSCSECQESFDEEDSANRHHATKHCVVSTLSDRSDADHWFFFENEENFKFYLANAADSGDFTRDLRGTWDGAGWYERKYGDEPCGRGCCSRDFYRFTHVDDVISSRIYEVKRVIKDIRELRKIAKISPHGRKGE